MAVSSAIRFQHRFVGPKNHKHVPYSRPSILNVWIDDDEQDHIIVRYGYSLSKDECWLQFRSDSDEELDAFWSGTHVELVSMIQANDLVIPGWNLRITMTSRMTHVLLEEPGKKEQN